MKVLVLLPYANIYPPSNGGMLRCFHILHQLVKRYETTAIMFQEREAFLSCIEFYPAFKNCEVISAKAINSNVGRLKLAGAIRSAIQYRFWRRSLKGPADGHFLTYYKELKTVLERHSPEVIILENTSCLNAVPVIRRHSPKTKIILNAHNVDSDLAESSLKEGFLRKKDWKRILKSESTLGKTIDAFIACSEKDLNRLLFLNKKRINATVIPNGVEIKPIRSKAQIVEEKRILFCGSLDYHPNREGLKWFLTNCWNQIKERVPDAKLDIIGSGNPGVLKELLATFKDVYLHGRVESVEPWYLQSGMIIVPLLHGSGTRLKVLEAMSFSKAIVSTSKGAEGIDYDDNVHLKTADTAVDFSNTCCQLLLDPAFKEKLGTNARKLVAEKYDWDLIGNRLSEFLENSESSNQNESKSATTC